MSKIILSIIIPAYNVEKYINECLDSLKPLFNNEKYEIIVIDDGSTDKTFNFAKKYLDNTNNMRLYHNDNQGLSKSRNFGIKKAKGQWLWFLDADDFIINVDKIIELNLLSIKQPIIKFKRKKFDSQTQQYVADDSYNKKMSKKNGLIYSLNNHKKTPIDISGWTSFFKKEIFFKLEWPDIVYEDVYFLSLLFSTNEVYFFNEFLYIYRINRIGSIIWKTRNTDTKYIGEIISFSTKHQNIDEYQIATLYILTAKLPFLNKKEFIYFKKLFNKYHKSDLYQWFFENNLIYKISYLILSIRFFWLFKIIISKRKDK